LDSLAYVGTPCQIQAIRKASVFQGESNKDWPGNAKILIGLFCRENWSYTCLRALVEDDYGTKMGDIKKFDIKRKRIIGYKEDGSSVEIPITYRMELKNGNWRTYDFLVENISLVQNYNRE